MLVDSRRRAAYLPRSIFLKSERLYEGRIQSLGSDLPFLMMKSAREFAFLPKAFLDPSPDDRLIF